MAMNTPVTMSRKVWQHVYDNYLRIAHLFIANILVSSQDPTNCSHMQQKSSLCHIFFFPPSSQKGLNLHFIGIRSVIIHIGEH